MWWILVLGIIAVVAMESEKEDKKEKEDEWKRQSAMLAKVKYVEIVYHDFAHHNTFTLIHQVDHGAEIQYHKKYQFFVDSSFFADYHKEKITLLDENKKVIFLGSHYQITSEEYDDCGYVILTIDEG